MSSKKEGSRRARLVNPRMGVSMTRREPAAVSIRRFAPADYDAVYALWKAAGWRIGLGRSDSRAEITRKRRRDPDLFLVAAARGRVIGTVLGGFDGRRGLIYHLAVAPDFRRRGIATRLMDEVEERLRAKGCLRCYLLVREEAADLVRFYGKRGWSPFGVTTLGKDLR